MKHIILIFIILISNINVFAEDSSPKVYVNNEIVIFDIDPIIEDGHMLAGLRPIFESMGMSVSWSPIWDKVIILNDAASFEVNPNYNTLLINRKVSPIEFVIKLTDSKMFVSLRPVLEAVGASVLWDSETNSVFVEYEPPVSKTVEDCTEAFDYLTSSAKSFSVGGVGYSGELSTEAKNFIKIFKSGNGKEYFKKLSAAGNDVGKLYALCGLYLLDNKNIHETIKTVEFKGTDISFMSGCLLGETSIESVKDGILSGFHPSMLYDCIYR